MKYVISLLVIGIIAVGIFWTVAKSRQNTSPNDTLITTNNEASTRSDSVNPRTDFTFAVDADPHMDEQSDPAVMKQTISNIVNAKSAFLIDLGDFAMVDKLPDKSISNIRKRFELMKSYYSLLGPSIPLYMVIGNHDGETGWDPISTTVKKLRLEYFPTRFSDRNYFSFETNNVLFVMLDPFSYTMTKPTNDGWKWTLGKTQYDWLKETLVTSQAKYKFVFIHHLVGGAITDGAALARGGIEVASNYEWGGKNLDGSYGFDTKRPGWGKPIHQLLLDNHVNAVFKGHDHFYAKQELDGIIYQTLPQPSHPGDQVNNASNYSYTSGKIIGGSGYLKIVVSSSGVIVNFIGQKTSLFSYKL
jgi:hypothetical protein